MTTWFNNARAILRRRQAKLRHSLDTDDDDEDYYHDDEQSKKHSESLKSRR